MEQLEPSFSLGELAEEAGVTPRTVRYYIQQGLLPSPGTVGPGTRYGKGFLDRLRLIRRMQDGYFPLTVIRERLVSLSDGDVARLLRAEAPESGSKKGSGAKSYIAQLKQQFVIRGESLGFIPPPAEVEARGPGSRVASRSQWEHVEIDPDVELHIRQPLTREQRKRVDRLLLSARQIWNEEPRQ